MKNEVFFRAMSDIDDDLIVASQSAPAISRRAVLRKIGSIAACFAFVCVVLVFALIGRGVDVTLYGEKLSSHPIPLDLAAPFSEDHPRTVTQSLSIPLEITSGGKVSAAVSDGVVSAVGDDGEALCSGRSIEVTAPVSLEWTLGTPDISKTYTVLLNKKTFTLAFDGASECWTMRK